MNVRELIAELQKHDPETTVVHSTGLMQDLEEVTGVSTPKDHYSNRAWDKSVNVIREWICID